MLVARCSHISQRPPERLGTAARVERSSQVNGSRPDIGQTSVRLLRWRSTTLESAVTSARHIGQSIIVFKEPRPAAVFDVVAGAAMAFYRFGFGVIAHLRLV